MSTVIKNCIRFVLFIFVQFFVLDKVPPLHQLVKPSLYFLFVLWLPFSVNRFGLLLVGFVYGLCMDYFLGTMGIHAAACVLIAYLRPFLLTVLLPQDSTEHSYIEPSIKSMGLAPYSIYVLILTFLHHVYVVFIEWTQFGNFFYFIGKVAASTGFSLLLIAVTEMLFYRKSSYRTNQGKSGY
ncbi:MAG: rod shape-determining protein MreD [Bacteroidetes bacterium]|jgi:hypothetical protein|nr:MAG: rod shape-determining protein MreD [Bacteroidota bacterium]